MVTSLEELVNPPSATRPNVESCSTFSWDVERSGMAGLPGGRGLNLAYEAVDRHVAGSRAEHVALRLIAKDGSACDVTYAGFADLTNRFAGALDELGVAAGGASSCCSRESSSST